VTGPVFKTGGGR